MEQVNIAAPGVALIKPEFLVQDCVRELNLDFVADKDKKRVSHEDAERDSNEPPKKKLKGQNKYRPRGQKAPKADKLCFKIGTEGSCPFGDSCCYSHDVSTYLSKKPPDIGPTCYLYQTFGKCPYSFSCRFAKNHIEDSKNLVLDDVLEKNRDRTMYKNNLTKDLQKSLRKRDYNFNKSNEVMKHLNSGTHKCQIEIKNTPVTVDQQNTSNQITKSDENISELKTIGESLPDLLPIAIVLKPRTQVSITENETTRASILGPQYIPLNIKNIPDTFLEPEIKKIDFKDKLYLAPLTTVGNLPFRRICKELGVDITCSEMALSLSLLQGSQSEWALMKRHCTEDIFGIQLCGNQPEIMTRCCQLLSDVASFDFIDINLGCPLDMIYRKGGGCGLMNRMKKLEGIVYGVSSVISTPLTLKMRTGIYGRENIAHNVIQSVKKWKTPISLITIHGRSREQRYTRSANWEYIDECNKVADPIPLFGNGDILSYEDYNMRRAETGVSGAMIARGALIKPWIFKEIKEQFHWDISSKERLEILRKYTNYGLEHWGSDTEGIEKTRRFLLEWLSFLCRYIPVGLLERPPQRINERPPKYFGRDDLETLMASQSCGDWVKISEMLLGPVPESFIFLPKHKANAYQ